MLHAPRSVSHVTATSSAECSWDSLLSSFISRQELKYETSLGSRGMGTGQSWPVSMSFTHVLHWPKRVQNQCSSDHWRHDRSKPVCWVPGSSTKRMLTAWADSQFSFQWLVTSTGYKSLHWGLRDVDFRRSGSYKSVTMGQSSCLETLVTSMSTAAICHRRGSSMFARTDRHGSGVGQSVTLDHISWIYLKM